MSDAEVLSIPKPGKRGGPCRREYCGHEGCRRDYELSRVKCTLCGEPIGFESGYVDETSDEEFAPPVLTHSICAAAAAANDAPPFNP